MNREIKVFEMAEEYYVFDFEDKPLEESIKFLQEGLNKVKEKYPNCTYHLKIKRYYDSSEMFSFVAKRQETDEEYNQRIADEKYDVLKKEITGIKRLKN